MSWDKDYWNACYRDSKRYDPADSDGWLEKYCFMTGERVLDLGCGEGTNLPFLLSRGVQVTAADLSPEAVQLVGSAFGTRLAGTDCFDMRNGLPYPGSSFDTIVADLSLHYFSWDETQDIITDLRRILKGGGRLIARVHSTANLPADAEPIAYGYYRAYGCDRRYFTAEDLRQLFAGWKLLTLEKTDAHRYGGIKKVIEFSVET